MDSSRRLPVRVVEPAGAGLQIPPRFSVTVPNPAEPVRVDRNGDVILGKDTAIPSTLSRVAADVFCAPASTPGPSDLNAIQQAILAAQSKGGDTNDPAEQVYVDRNGDVILGSDAGGDTRQLSSVAKDTFYAVRDIASERAFVSAKMPRNTIHTRSGDFDGYAFSITNRLGDSYSLFLYWSDLYGCYRVSLVSPRLGGQLDVHGGHLYSDNTLCLTRKEGSGYPSIEHTYAKAGLWTLGASLYRRGYGFQFNTD